MADHKADATAPLELKDEDLDQVTGGADKPVTSPKLYGLRTTGEHLKSTPLE